jgi:peptidyl-prolyl cis-trans isomerase A (cyclophilin A)
MFRAAMHHFRTVLFGALLVAGCENTPKPKETAPEAPKPAEPAKPDPNALPTQPKPDPTPGADVAPPTAADLATYTKDLPGTGSKILMTMETSQGTFHCELYGDKAPMTVANWVGLATGKKPWLNPKTGNVERGKPYFDGLIFHRVIPGFMIQGGDPLGQGFGGPGYNFNDEIWQGQHVGAGVLAMANAGVRGGQGTNGSQFFIMEGDRPDLDSKHTVFGKCNEIDLIKKIEGVPRDDNDKPNDPVTINKVTITKG